MMNQIQKNKEEMQEYDTEKSSGNMPEAKASVTYSLTSPKGFPLLFTIRSEDENDLLTLMDSMDLLLSDRGYAPEARRGTKPAPQIVEGEKCPKCGSNLVKFTTKTGKTGVQCSTRKYNPETKMTSGCDYVKWDEDKTMGEPATEAQKKVLEKQGLWVEGMTKSQAMQTISDSMSS